MNVEEILIRQLKLQNDLQEENNRLLREILRVLIMKIDILLLHMGLKKKKILIYLLGDQQIKILIV